MIVIIRKSEIKKIKCVLEHKIRATAVGLVDGGVLVFFLGAWCCSSAFICINKSAQI